MESLSSKHSRLNLSKCNTSGNIKETSGAMRRHRGHLFDVALEVMISNLTLRSTKMCDSLELTPAFVSNNNSGETRELQTFWTCRFNEGTLTTGITEAEDQRQPEITQSQSHYHERTRPRNNTSFKCFSLCCNYIYIYIHTHISIGMTVLENENYPYAYILISIFEPFAHNFSVHKEMYFKLTTFII